MRLKLRFKICFVEVGIEVDMCKAKTMENDG